MAAGDKRTFWGMENVPFTVIEQADGSFILASGTATSGGATLRVGEIQGSTSASVLPTIACTLVRFKALISNVGNVYVGGAGVTLPNGTTDTTTGLELAPGDDTGWIPIDNLNRFYRICSNLGDDMTYMLL